MIIQLEFYQFMPVCVQMGKINACLEQHYHHDCLMCPVSKYTQHGMGQKQKQ